MPGSSITSHPKIQPTLSLTFLLWPQFTGYLWCASVPIFISLHGALSRCWHLSYLHRTCQVVMGNSSRFKYICYTWRIYTCMLPFPCRSTLDPCQECAYFEIRTSFAVVYYSYSFRGKDSSHLQWDCVSLFCQRTPPPTFPVSRVSDRVTALS